MSVEDVLARGRAAALQLLRDTCLVERKAGDPELDETTGQLTQPWVAVYTGPCRVKRDSDGRDAQYGEHEVTLHRYHVHLAWNSSPEIQREDRLTVTASDDTWLVGRHLEVVDVGYAGTATARRLVVEDRAG